MINRRGYGHLGRGEYLQDDAPVREGTEATGHAVRQLYLASGAVDVYLETGDETLRDAMLALWHSAFREKTYITGGPGSRAGDEAFGDPFELPPDRAYAETCAAIAGFMFNWRLLLATGEARFADEMERALYNGIAGSTAPDGRRFFYANPLQTRGPFERQPWFACACCPTNLARLLASLHHYVATTDESGIQLHLLTRARVEAEGATLEIETDYPWDGRVEIRVAAEGPFELAVRMPAWSAQPGYRRWSVEDGDAIAFELDMPVRLVQANPRVDAVRGCVALARGPLVYCVEDIDHDAPLEDLRLDPARPPRVAGDHRLSGVALVAPPPPEALYGDFAIPPPAHREVPLTAIPYFRWANRGASAMRVWIPHEVAS
jgi:DUF1680 family protein